MISRINDYTLNLINSIYNKKEVIKNPTCYFYDLDIIKSNIELIKKYSLEQVNLYYAMKANNNHYIMDSICNNDTVKGIEIASAGELFQASLLLQTKLLVA